MSTTVQDIIKNKAKEIAQEVIEIRHHIHSNPELSFQEFETAKFVETYLQSLGLHTHRISVRQNKTRNGIHAVCGIRASIRILSFI